MSIHNTSPISLKMSQLRSIEVTCRPSNKSEFLLRKSFRVSQPKISTNDRKIIIIQASNKNVQVSNGSKPVENVFTRDLQFGDRGKDVRRLQSDLLQIKSNGKFDAATHEGLKSWQRLNDLPQTGYFGKLSRAKAELELNPPVTAEVEVAEAAAASLSSSSSSSLTGSTPGPNPSVPVSTVVATASTASSAPASATLPITTTTTVQQPALPASGRPPPSGLPPVWVVAVPLLLGTASLLIQQPSDRRRDRVVGDDDGNAELSAEELKEQMFEFLRMSKTDQALQAPLGSSMDPASVTDHQQRDEGSEEDMRQAAGLAVDESSEEHPNLTERQLRYYEEAKKRVAELHATTAEEQEEVGQNPGEITEDLQWSKSESWWSPIAGKLLGMPGEGEHEGEDQGEDESLEGRQRSDAWEQNQDEDKGQGGGGVFPEWRWGKGEGLSSRAQELTQAYSSRRLAEQQEQTQKQEGGPPPPGSFPAKFQAPARGDLLQQIKKVDEFYSRHPPPLLTGKPLNPQNPARQSANSVNTSSSGTTSSQTSPSTSSSATSSASTSPDTSATPSNESPPPDSAPEGAVFSSAGMNNVVPCLTVDADQEASIPETDSTDTDQEVGWVRQLSDSGGRRRRHSGYSLSEHFAEEEQPAPLEDQVKSKAFKTKKSKGNKKKNGKKKAT